jgi:ferrochelatase
MSAKPKLAVVLFNLGGPDSLDAVQPFLFNLFNDAAIIRLPQPLRWLIAKLISSRRAKVAQHIYAQIGGRSPILPQTEAQARALEKVLGQEFEARAFIAMRYWHPFSDETAKEVVAWGPDEVVLLPLYPQFSTTTTESSLKDWARAAKAVGLKAPSFTVQQYPVEAGFVEAYAKLLRSILSGLKSQQPLQVLFSAHGLPEKIVLAGDPYPEQIAQSCAAIARAANLGERDWRLSYQSRVGPMKWIGPSTEEEIRRAGAEGRGLVVLPVAFVSEHSETLVELDIEYAQLAREVGVPLYVRVATVQTEPEFIEGLASLVRTARGGD